MNSASAKRIIANLIKLLYYLSKLVPRGIPLTSHAPLSYSNFTCLLSAPEAGTLGHDLAAHPAR